MASKDVRERRSSGAVDTKRSLYWVDRELAGCKFKDERLGNRFRQLLGQLSSSPGANIPLVCQDWTNTKAAYRFLDNERVIEADILAGHFHATRDRAALTTEFTYQREDIEAIGGVTSALPVLQGALQSAAANPLSYVVGDTVAAAGSGIGAGIANEVAPGNQSAEMIGLLAGGAAPALGGAAFRGASQSATTPNDLASLQSAGVQPTAGQDGNAGVRHLESVLGGLPGGNHVLSQAYEDQAGQIGTRMATLANNVGEESAGKTVERGVSEFVTRSQRTASRLWGMLDNAIAPDALVSMPATKAQLAALTGKGPLSEAFVSPTIAKAAQAAKGVAQVPYQELRDLRSQIGAKLGQPDLISDIPRAELKQLYSALTNDEEQNEDEQQGHSTNLAFARPCVSTATQFSPVW